MPASKTKALIRILTMLKIIPVAPKWILTKDIHRHLCDQPEMEVTRRTVERDLMELTNIFGLTFGDSPEGYKWSFSYDSPYQFIPSIGIEEALSLKMVQTHLHNFLPSQTFEKLSALFIKSDHILRQKSSLAQWPNLIKEIPSSLSFKPINVDQVVINNIYTALLEQKCLEIRYHKKNKFYRIKPVGILVRDCKLVLVCQYEGYENLRNLLVHRIHEAIVTNEKHQLSIDLQSYINKQAVAVSLSKKNIKLVIEVKGYVKGLLTENTLTESQKLTHLNDTWARVQADVPYNLELENWLQSQIQHIKIIAPISIKERIIKKLNEAIVINM
ncbi:helix-turn-helix transcriptional regulator [Shewanella sp. 10N.286.48.B5]|uniref:helix-turn-helix transcriptional regulator n=1 Tax=Shewanella sp. 10N.286.48.B5 TaxID=1880834 RepID=UPI000C836A21|nr:WYL domain-containing protein [Shewanella sp. 10N.286.48.B5]PMH87924.1 hypothetical protein BCU57_20205 [Shewanella sp. 10N.286.48.B5]